MRPFKRVFANVMLVLTLVILSAPGFAQQKYLDEFKDWFAYREDQGAVRLCYIASIPKKETGKYTSRGETFILVTLNIDGTVTKLVTNGASAWSETDKSDRELAAAMAKGRQLIVTGYSSRGTKTTDTYSLAGFTAAFKAIGKACGVK